MLRSRRTARLLTIAAGATFILGFAGAGTASAFDVPDLPEIGFPPITFDPCLINPQSCDPGPTVPDGPGDLTTETTTTTVPDDDTPDPTVPDDDTPVVPTADLAPVVVATPHFTG